MKETEWFCHNCGEQIGELKNGRFCPNCGTMVSKDPPEESVKIDISEPTSDIIDTIFRELEVDDKIPTTEDDHRKVVKIGEERITMQVGVETGAKKYTDREMLRYAINCIKDGDEFDSSKLESKFPKKYSQGSCVFSMTGGLLVFFNLAISKDDGNNRTIYLKKEKINSSS